MLSIHKFISISKFSSETRHYDPYNSNQNEIKPNEMDDDLERDVKLGDIQKNIRPKECMMSNPVSSTQFFISVCYSQNYIIYTQGYIELYTNTKLLI